MLLKASGAQSDGTWDDASGNGHHVDNIVAAPRYLPHTGQDYIECDGVAGSLAKLGVADDPALEPTGDEFEVWWYAETTTTDWQRVLQKTGATHGFDAYFDHAGRMGFRFGDGTTMRDMPPSNAGPARDGVYRWFRWKFNSADGGNTTVETSSGPTFDDVGRTVHETLSVSGNHPIANDSTLMSIGNNGIGSHPWRGSYSHLVLVDGFGGDEVFRLDVNDANGALAWNDSVNGLQIGLQNHGNTEQQGFALVTSPSLWFRAAHEIYAAHHADLDLVAPFTASWVIWDLGWMRQGTFRANRIVGKAATVGEGNHGWVHEWDSINTRVFLDSPTTSLAASQVAHPTEGRIQVHSITLEEDGTFTYWVDGVPDASPATGQTGDYSNTEALRFGRDPGGGGPAHFLLCGYVQHAEIRDIAAEWAFIRDQVREI